MPQGSRPEHYFNPLDSQRHFGLFLSNKYPVDHGASHAIVTRGKLRDLEELPALAYRDFSGPKHREVISALGCRLGVTTKSYLPAKTTIITIKFNFSFMRFI